MHEKNNIQDFFKWYFKYFFISIIICFILVGLIYLYTNYETEEDKYYNNYYEINKDKLEEIKDYVINNNLEGYVYLYGRKGLGNDYTSLKQYDGRLGNHCINNKCIFLINIAEKIDVNLISNFYYSDNKNIYNRKGRVITIKPKYKIYGNNENRIKYIKGYFKGKKRFHEINGNRSKVIVRIFNDDWGVINWDYD